ncbi:MAG: antibiotic biosynthesis monooxygenase [Planctomycetes bacterium]|nr:antibiotic biosynthesis monooxygenase [Planctomycetota bacterium]
MYVILWQFVVREGCAEAFQQVYGADGDWAKFFRTGTGFVGVELLCDPRDPRKFVTIDRWETATDYEEFSRRNAIKYREIDERCEQLTVKETHVGSFDVVGHPLEPDNRE